MLKNIIQYKLYNTIKFCVCTMSSSPESGVGLEERIDDEKTIVRKSKFGRT
jgi:hypothetical protein